jgi:hypothetical protein
MEASVGYTQLPTNAVDHLEIRSAADRLPNAVSVAIGALSRADPVPGPLCPRRKISNI